MKWMGAIAHVHLMVWTLGLAALSGCREITHEQGWQAKEVRIDGSSTVYPISQAMAEEFQAANPDITVVVGTSGTGGGFTKLVDGAIDISNASRPIAPSEAEDARKNGVDYLEFQVALDGLSVVVNPANDWVDCLTIEQLRRIWEPGSQVRTWSDLDPIWPNEEIKLYGPGPDSGTFDYFTEVVTGKTKASRTDYTSSEDDNALVQGVTGDKYALGYFGFAYYTEYRDKLKALAISDGQKADCVKPSKEAILSGEYTPLSRPLYIYVNKASLKRPEVAAFLKFYLGEGQQLVPEIGYVPISPDTQQQMQQQLSDALVSVRSDNDTNPSRQSARDK